MHSNKPINILLLHCSAFASHSFSHGISTYYYTKMYGEGLRKDCQLSFSILLPEKQEALRLEASRLTLTEFLVPHLSFWTTFILQKAHLDIILSKQSFQIHSLHLLQPVKRSFVTKCKLKFIYFFFNKSNWCPGKLLGLFLSLMCIIFFLLFSSHHIF